MGQRGKDRRYATPRTTRHVWVRPEQPGVAPVQGYVLEWRRHSYRWTALVLVSGADREGRPTASQQWVPAERLTPVRSDPNNGGRVRSLG